MSLVLVQLYGRTAVLEYVCRKGAGALTTYSFEAVRPYLNLGTAVPLREVGVRYRSWYSYPGTGTAVRRTQRTAVYSARQYLGTTAY